MRADFGPNRSRATRVREGGARAVTTDPDTRFAADTGPPRAAMIAAVALTVVTIGVILAIAATREAPPQPLAVAAFPAPQASGTACRTLADALPRRLRGLE